jgi:hypothetical protein
MCVEGDMVPPVWTCNSDHRERPVRRIALIG